MRASCASVADAAGTGTYSVSAYACQTGTGECTERLDVPGLEISAEALFEALGCEEPPPEECDECLACPVGSGGGPSVGGGPPGFGPPQSGPGAFLRYRGHGVGHPDFPGTPEWNVTLGRYWSHDYAERIVEDPGEHHVWLLTRFGAFHEFADLVDGEYRSASPSTEYRRMTYDEAGWQLRGLDGTVRVFDLLGRWVRTVDRNGNTTEARYEGGVLESVSFPDGRRETFSYHGDGKLASITEVGVDGVSSRTWHYTWSGLDLERIERPDGTAWEFEYADGRHPGLMTLMTLVGSDGSRRVERGWDYDGRGNVLRTWRGDADFTGAGAVEKYSFVYDNPFQPRKTEVTDPLGNVSTYEIDRDPGGLKTRVKSIVGDCPTCGLGPDTRLFYDDAANPMRPTREIDARGTTTLFEYDRHGQVTSRTEAMGTALERTTTWSYHDLYPALVTEIQRPSTSGSGVRRTSWTYDREGNATVRTDEGVENGSAFRYETVTYSTPAGQPQSVNPPGYGERDVTRFDYDPARGGLVLSSRTDPLIGTTDFDSDAFNREVRVTDPNGVATVTSYDALDRVLTIAHKGAVESEDLVTTRVYDVFGDLVRILLPEGNVIEHGYDEAGRLTFIERKPDVATHGERVVYELDDYGHRVREELQVWEDAGWVTKFFEEYVYTTRCQLDMVVHADGTVTEYAYDCDGNLEREWDANHPSHGRTNPATTVYGYDALDRLRTLTQPWGGEGGGTVVTRYDYDVQDHLTKITDPNRNVTSYVFSDRDLLTREESEVSGLTTRVYNDHGRQVLETDARGVTVERFVDELDRVLFVDYPETGLDVRYVYDDPAVAFARGRLTAIIRHGESVDYRYDRFGRVTRDGALTYDYDKNGNRTTIGYPGQVTATYAYDYADRQETLTIRDGDSPEQPIVTAASYLPSGPLTSLDLGNGLTETRRFTSRYFPESITVPERLSWTYSTDAVGNISTITDNLEPGSSRVFDYQDYQYYLTVGNGPWGELSWAYDRIGNRLHEIRDGVKTVYSYEPNHKGLNSPKLSAIQEETPKSSPTRYFYDSAGNFTHESDESTRTRYAYGADGRLTEIRHDARNRPPTITEIMYDGRDFLSRSSLTLPGTSIQPPLTRATYSTGAVLHHRSSLQRSTPSQSRDTTPNKSDDFIFYFNNLSVAHALKEEVPAGSQVGTGETVVRYLSVDHIGRPILATNTSGGIIELGLFEPFGTNSIGRDVNIFLRLPGQWEDQTWIRRYSQGLYYNVYRWYKPNLGTYTRTDPLDLENPNGVSIHDYAYGNANPVRFIDPLGLYAVFDDKVFKFKVVGGFKIIEKSLSKAKDDCCQKYFSDLGIDIDSWVDSSGGPPYVRKAGAAMVRKLNKKDACGFTQKGQPFLYFWINPDCFKRPDPCKMASVIMHEMGHLARNDKVDNEPSDFFKKCKLGCVDPGRFH